MKKLLLLMLVLICVCSANAINTAIMAATAISSSASSSNAAREAEEAAVADQQFMQSTGCQPPIPFSRENNCLLHHDRFMAVNEYTCGPHTVLADCQGNVYDIQTKPFASQETVMVFSISSILFMMTLSLGFIFFMLRGA